MNANAAVPRLFKPAHSASARSDHSSQRSASPGRRDDGSFCINVLHLF
jgi:hypothetical protein